MIGLKLRNELSTLAYNGLAGSAIDKAIEATASRCREAIEMEAAIARERGKEELAASLEAAATKIVPEA